ncbi:serine-rich adhesin for platelets-like [Anopheles albimanus]|uniref:BTB domain-containing protein n=1 Tax=Anopheles albimanus TaxID=7167 RepID=A0A182FHW1_ANOAL|nr:serine-rich adhesin for platelets-like [Anopheles albimanus]XP_035792329.1 serine-rich adhesin for platelets-like [Anopheles albimanus]XP_035792330.1 serine-rich adhesin for platelets-like [Anopheles albimanus]XP_035792331.1 serine-rich adhesin for platelets-like [Anopheles albimanus]XP_035792332.1 serine-rich adhesin for platelets-like [Anopheles albimanus]XP_035792333.1 serine-rich adhesin for platelets-like [Anopheles albimanus]XP_035792334.1 serine-rich adhesin for platelets-like [Anop
MESVNPMVNVDDDTLSAATASIAASTGISDDRRSSLPGVVYRLSAIPPQEQDGEESQLRKGLNRVSTDSATSTYEMVEAAGSSHSPASDSNSSSTEEHDGVDADDDEEDDGEEEDEEMWSNIVRINKATSATVAELTGGSSSSTTGASNIEIIEYEVQGPMISGTSGIAMATESFEREGGGLVTDADASDLLLQRKRFDLARSSTKEEKQRHNEEIVIMKSNSLSSDTNTNSWEPVSVEACCADEEEQPAADAPAIVVPSAPSKACFIDASSLFDDEEIVYPSFQEPQVAWGPPSVGATSSQSHSASNVQLSSILIRDEEKSIRPTSGGMACDEVKDQFSVASSDDYLASKLKHSDPGTESSSSTIDNEEVLARQQSERKQGTLLFQNSIQQFSGLLIDGPATGCPVEEAYSDLSLPSVYSSGSERNYGGEYGPLSISDTQRYSLTSAGLTCGGATEGFRRLSGNGGTTSTTSGYNSSSAEYNSRTQATSDVESSGHYPHTPFNSIVHVGSSTSTTTVHQPVYASGGEGDGNGSRASSIDRDSHSTPIRIPKRVQKHDESAPIVSGGASIEDFTPKQCESPSVRRRTDTCPIVSGGISFDEDPRDSQQHQQQQGRLIGGRLSKSSSGKSWVVDLKNCPDDEKRVAANSLDVGNGQQQSRSCGLGFYVDLGALKTPEEEKAITVNRATRPSVVRSDMMKKSTGFYIDLSDGESTRSATPKLSGRNETPPPSATLAPNDSGNESAKQCDSREGSTEKDRKNMFSMFIDIGDEKNGNGTARPPTSLIRKHSVPQVAATTIADEKEPAGMIRPISLSSTGAAGDGAVSKPYYMFVGASEVPAAVVRRQTNGSSVAGSQMAKNESKRHSWNATTFAGEQAGGSGFHERRIASSASYQRSTSVTSDRGIMNILDKIPLLSKTSSMSIDSSVSPFEDFTCSKSELSTTYSNHSISSHSGHSSNDSKGGKDGTEEGAAVLADAPTMVSSVKRHRRDAKLNETFDKSSQGSVTDGVLSSNEDASPTSTTTDTDDVTFQNNPADETSLHGPTETISIRDNKGDSPVKLSSVTSSKQMETIVEAVESSPRHTATQQRKAQHTMESLHATIEKQKQLLETVTENIEQSQNQVSSSFVKLSDMDKPPAVVPTAKFELHSSNGAGAGGLNNMSSSAGSNRVARLFESQKYNTIGSAVGVSNQAIRQHQQHQQKTANYYHANGITSMERHSWNMSRSTGNNFVSLISSSVENSRSLSRLFPHLTKAFSSSLPSDVGMNGTGRDGSEFMNSDFSCTSSITSSRSGIESIDESISSRQPRRLGEDLLKMFLQEIATDVTIEVETRKMRAHKCILRSRCQYFAAILAGSWVQNAGNVIALPGYSYAAVHFALCHIYSGASHPPEGISLMELAALSDLLGLEGLKEVTAYALKTNYCHNFHKPCSGCTDGVLQVLPVTLNHGLDDLYRKCLKWVCRHYVKIWSQKQFSQLPLDVVHRCKQQIVAHLNSESVITMILDSEQLLTLLHPYKWSLEVENVVRDILDAAYDYITDHFASLLASDSFLSLGQNYRWAIPHIEPILLPAANNLSADQACKSYPRATRLHKLLQAKVLTMTTTTPMSSSDNTNVVNVYDNQQQNQQQQQQQQGGKRKNAEYNLQEEEMDWCDEFVGMVNAILSAVEQCLIRQCARAMRVSSWQRMDVELRNKIQKLACLMETTDERKSRSRYSFSSQTSSTSSVHSRTNDLRQVRLAIQAHTKRAYESQSNTNAIKLQQQTQTITVAQHNDLNSALLASHKLAKHLEEDMRAKQKDHQPPENGRISKTASKSNVPAEGSKKSYGTASTTNGRHTNGIKMGLLSKTNRDPSIPVTAVTVTSSSATHIQHKRSQSEDHAVYGSAKTTMLNGKSGETTSNLRAKLSHVKPRYLEPKKPKNAANLHAQNNNLSSSGSSTRTSSPALGHSRKPKQLAATVKVGGTESNISLDSLTSPAKLRNANVPAKAPRSTISELDVSIDSLAESLKSNSIKTNNTLSHESLIYHEYFKPKPINDQIVPNANPTKEKRVGKTLGTSKPSTVNGGGLKAPHVSSIPRSNGSGINRTGSSASVGSNGGYQSGGSAVVKRSFLSQRSREILARRSHEPPKSNSTNSSNKSAASSPSLLLTRDKSTGSDITKSGSSASLTTANSTSAGGASGGRKVFNTTLHLRRTAKLLPAAGGSQEPTMAPVPTSRHHSTALHRKADKSTIAPGAKPSRKTDPQTAVGPMTKGSLTRHGPAANGYTGGNQPPVSLPPPTIDAGRKESKLERSNTFSMDASDNTLLLQLLE